VQGMSADFGYSVRQKLQMIFQLGQDITGLHAQRSSHSTCSSFCIMQ
jgi:hypothetical protein